MKFIYLLNCEILDFIDFVFVLHGVWHIMGIPCVLLYDCFSPVVVQSLSHVWLFCAPWTVTHQAPMSMGLSRQKILEWVAISFSRGSSQPRDWTHVFCIGRQILSHWPITLTARKPIFFFFPDMMLKIYILIAGSMRVSHSKWVFLDFQSWDFFKVWIECSLLGDRKGTLTTRGVLNGSICSFQAYRFYES